MAFRGTIVTSDWESLMAPQVLWYSSPDIRADALKGGELVYEGDPKSINEAWFEKIYGAGAKEVHIN